MGDCGHACALVSADSFIRISAWQRYSMGASACSTPAVDSERALRTTPAHRL